MLAYVLCADTRKGDAFGRVLWDNLVLQPTEIDILGTEVALEKLNAMECALDMYTIIN